MKLNISFFKQFLGLSKWAFLAQLLLVVSYIVTTHWYTPQAFGIKAAIMSVILLLTNFSLGKLELAIPVVKEEATAKHLTLISLLFLMVTTVLTIVVCLFLLFVDYQNSFWLIIRPYWWVLPIFLILLSVYYLLNYWMIRLEAFDVLGQQQGKRAVYKLGIESIGVLFGGQAIFLLGGLLVGSIGGIGAFLKKLKPPPTPPKEGGKTCGGILGCLGFYPPPLEGLGDVGEQSKSLGVKIRSLVYHQGFCPPPLEGLGEAVVALARRYSLFIVPTDFLHRLSSDLPIYALTAYASVEYLGYYNVALTLVNMAGSVVIEPFFQLYLSHFSKVVQTSQAAAREYFLESLKKIIVFGLIISLGICCLGKVSLIFLLGEKWRVSGELLTSLGFLFFATFLHNFGFHTLNVIGRQRTQLVYALLRFFILALGIFFFLENSYTLITIFVLGSLALSLGFVLYTTKILAFAKEKNRLS